MFLIVGPEAYSLPPVDTWTMPSEPASAKPCSAAFNVWEELMLIAGYANEPFLAASSISAYTSGVAMGMISGSSRGVSGQSCKGRTRLGNRLVSVVQRRQVHPVPAGRERPDG